MKGNPVIAIVLIIIGVVALAYQGITYTTKEKAVDLGPIQISKEEKHRIPLSPVLGVIALVGGIWLLAAGKK